MPHAFAIGGTLISSEEYAERDMLSKIDRFSADAIRSQPSLIESRGRFEKGPELFPGAEGAYPQFEPIGIGKPMSIEILAVYTGDAPTKWWGGQPDLLVASAVKSIETFDAQPRAINQLVSSIVDNQFIQPSAKTSGCPIVYYTPSLASGTILCSLELASDTFDKQTFSQIASLFSAAAGLPVFVPASAYLIAGSFLVKILADLGKAILQPNPFLAEDITFRFDTPNMPLTFSQQMVVFNQRDSQEMTNFKLGLAGEAGNQRAVLVHKSNGEVYAGSAPYMIISLDGRKRPELDGFTPRLASAAMLDRFYRGADVGGQTIEALGSALELYNDFTFRQRAERISTQIQALDQNSPTYAKEKDALDKLYAAYLGNVRNSLFKLQ